MKTVAFLALMTFLLLGCEQEVPTANVTFSVHENSPDNPEFTIEYTSDQSGGTTVGSNNDNYWTSGQVILNEGQYISLKASCTGAQYDLVLYIYVNGGLWKTTSFSAPNGSAVLSGEIPAQ